MTYWDRKVMREQLDKKLSLFRDAASTGRPQNGWIRSIRAALGISASQLAKKAGMDQPRISRIEKAEKSGDLRISSLQKIAAALNMKFIYGFVPKGTLEDMVRGRAKAIALKRLKRLNDTMRLEVQGLSKDEENKALKDMIDKILIEEDKGLWDE